MYNQLQQIPNRPMPQGQPRIPMNVLQGLGSHTDNIPNTQQPHPLFQGRAMAHQMPPTPHSGAVHHLLQHAVPIYHQINALKKALGTGSAGNKNNPAGIQGF